MKEANMKIEKLSKEFDQIIGPGAEIEEIQNGLIFTEGPVWNSELNALLFSDIPANKIYMWSEKEGRKVFRENSHFANGLTYNSAGELIACEHQSRSVTRTDKNGEIHEVATHYKGKKLNSPNDVVATADGSILFTDPIYGLSAGSGGPAEAELDFQGVYISRPGADPQKPDLITDSFERPNGLAFTPDGKRLFVADTVRQHIRAFDVEDGFKCSGGCVWAELWDDEFNGRPDGMKFDLQGNLFSAGPGGVWIFNPDADVIGRIYLPDKTSNLAWGDDGHSLYITASAVVFRIRCKTEGQILV
jgi:gluconolactonase